MRDKECLITKKIVSRQNLTRGVTEKIYKQSRAINLSVLQ